MTRTLVAQIKDLRKNYFINADHAISQRNNTSFISPVDGQYLQDRWQYIKSSVATHTVTRDSDVPTIAQAGRFVAQSMRLNLTAADVTIAIGDYLGVGQILEGFNWGALAQRAFTLSFWVKAPVAGTYCVAFRNSTPDRSYVAEYTISASEATTWVKRTITVPASPAAGTWNYTNGAGLRVHWMLAVGGTFQTTANSWNTGNFMGTSNQVNALNSTGTPDFRIALPMINEGETAAPFSLFSDFSGSSEIKECQRYYEKNYDLTVTPGTVLGAGSEPNTFRGYNGAPTATRGMSCFATHKRTTPSMTFYSGTSATPGNIDLNGVASPSAAFVANHAGVWVENNTATNGAYTFGFHFTADAEIS